jgi:uncharacterized membrane protein
VPVLHSGGEIGRIFSNERPNDVEALLHTAMHWCVLGIEGLAVAVIVIAIVDGAVRYVAHLNARAGDVYQFFKVRLVKSLLLGLELLVAADIVRTVAEDATLLNVAVLGAIVFVRTFLSWSLVVEMEGRWPWQSVTSNKPPATVREAT